MPPMCTALPRAARPPGRSGSGRIYEILLDSSLARRPNFDAFPIACWRGGGSQGGVTRFSGGGYPVLRGGLATAGVPTRRSPNTFNALAANLRGFRGVRPLGAVLPNGPRARARTGHEAPASPVPSLPRPEIPSRARAYWWRNSHFSKFTVNRSKLHSKSAALIPSVP
jgi:hypothetical protein